MFPRTIAARIARASHVVRAALMCLLVAALFLSLVTARAQTTRPALPPGTPLLPADALEAFAVAGQRDAVEARIVPVTGQPFDRAWRLETKPARFDNIYSVQLQATPTGAVRQGDVLLATFYVRGVSGGQAETGEAQTQFVFERGSDPFTKSVEQNVAVPKNEWRRIDLPFTAAEDGAAGATQIGFRLGYAPQVIEIGGISLVNYGDTVRLRDLPRTPATYAGREANAAWRRAAAARIERIRKAGLTIRVTDKNGKPVPNARVQVRMKRHAFPFGTAVAAQALLGDGPDNEKYREIIADRFNLVVLENDLKWPGWEENPERAKQAVAWLRARDIPVRGHNLVWPSWRWLPQSVRALRDDPTALDKRVKDHIRDEVTALRGQVVAWDVVNEPFANHDLMDILGKDKLAEWFTLTHQLDPKPRLFLNDYPPLDGAATGNTHLNHFEATLRWLLEKKAPLGGIGFQGHFGGGVIPPERVLSGLDRFAKLGLPIEITEFDVNTTDERFQADYLRDFYTAAFSHPSVSAILMWGFWEGRHWLPNAALWRRDWSVKPNGQAFLDLVFKTWWTNADGKTDGRGLYQTRGFLGDYEVTVTANNKTRTMALPLTKASKPWTVALP